MSSFTKLTVAILHHVLTFFFAIVIMGAIVKVFFGDGEGMNPWLSLILLFLVAVISFFSGRRLSSILIEKVIIPWMKP